MFLKRSQLQDPYYRFRSPAEVQQAARLGVRIDVNQASIDDWLRLPGLSIHQARSLVTLALSGVQYHCIDDLAAALSVPIQRLQPLEPILQFCYYAPHSSETPVVLRVNLASIADLIKLPGVDWALAEAIVQNRQQQGPYRNLVDFQQRLGLSGEVTADLMHYLRF